MATGKPEVSGSDGSGTAAGHHQPARGLHFVLVSINYTWVVYLASAETHQTPEPNESRRLPLGQKDIREGLDVSMGAGDTYVAAAPFLSAMP